METKAAFEGGIVVRRSFLLAFTHGLLHRSGAATREGERGRQRRSRDNDAGVKWDVNEARGEVL